jgi:hypothetical protein
MVLTLLPIYSLGPIVSFEYSTPTRIIKLNLLLIDGYHLQDIMHNHISQRVALQKYIEDILAELHNLILRAQAKARHYCCLEVVNNRYAQDVCSYAQ